MAKIILEPNEQFEYFHTDESIIKLVKGELVYDQSNKSIQLKAGDTIITPIQNTHSLRNIGKVPAIMHLYRVECGFAMRNI